MTSAKTAIIVCLSCGATIGFFGWRYRASQDGPIVQSVEIVDRSLSVTNLPAAVVALGRRAFDLPGMRRGSTLTVMATGDEATANEPLLVARYEVPISRRALEDKRAEEVRKEDVLTDLAARWNKLGRTERSPIFLAVKRGVEQLRSSGCTPQSACYLFIKTDGEELLEPGIKNALRGSEKGPLPEPIGNEGVKIVFCGLSETTGSTTKGDKKLQYTQVRDAKYVDRLRKVWSALFTNPDLVSFEPYCSGVEIEQQGTTKLGAQRRSSALRPLGHKENDC
ncbi:hypothetical protein MYX75_02250 [Acidobacteria bacterium AH-259-A15]|nr:hypothetical protein [Acidobacteria bacterium AH-259-A15]